MYACPIYCIHEQNQRLKTCNQIGHGPRNNVQYKFKKLKNQ